MIGEFEPQVGEDRSDGRPEAERTRLFDRGRFLTPNLGSNPSARVGDRDEGIEHSPDVAEEKRHELQADPEPDQQRITRDVDRAVRVTPPGRPHEHAEEEHTDRSGEELEAADHRAPGVDKGPTTVCRSNEPRLRPERAERHKGTCNGEAGRPRQLPGRQRQIGAAADAVSSGRRCTHHRHARKDGGDAEATAASHETVSSMRS